ncbi:DEAD/DEAH box helicase [Duganella vulcania]|uniref:ATP-dependent helicase n=1 Tax=Duganella vulcania TaxID=2692166 RepID=A0A845GIP3_9BURK|nr:DEAD/DEAH box helicase [Duganella vulcania]MYM93861.1 ATP-dependent helicase [Duganella vulcania]
MTDAKLLAEFDTLEFNEKMILALLALIGEPVGRTSILDHLNRARIEDKDGNAYSVGTLDEALRKLERLAFISVVTGRGFVCNPKLRWPAMRASIGTHALDDLCNAYDELVPMRQTWNSVEPRSYRAGMARLRMGLLRGQTPQQIQPILAFCLGSYEAAQLHPIVDIFGRPFEPGMLARVHPLLQDDVLMVLLQNAQHEFLTVPVIREFCEQHMQRRQAAKDDISPELRMALAEDAILCGRLDDAKRYLERTAGPQSQYLASAVVLLRGASGAAIVGFDAALKTLRRDTGKRKHLLTGMGGYLYLLSMLRSGDPKHLKAAEAYLEIAVRMPQNRDTAVHQQIDMLRQIRAGIMPPAAVSTLAWETGLQTQMFQCLLYFWLSLPQLSERKAQLEELAQNAERAGYLFIAGQAACLLGHLGDVEQQRHANALRSRLGYPDLTVWFERQEAWQRQLTALINLQQPAAVDAAGSTRLVWMLNYDNRHGLTDVAPVEQKRDARGLWSKGRAVGLKRLRFEAEQFDFLTPQDVRASEAISVAHRTYQSSGLAYEIDPQRAASALIGHPLLFWADAPDTRVEMLAGEPELLIKKSPGNLELRLQPPIPDDSSSVIVTKETPTRLRVVTILDEHRRIAAIVGDGLSVPAHAEQQVLHAISSISSLVTVQSEIGGAAPDMEQVEADMRLHLHLLPYQHGLKMQVLVRPLANGAYYAPGAGADSVIADVNGKPVQARRKLIDERDAERELIAKCPVLESAEQEHGEWLLGQPALCLQLLVELQEMNPDSIVLAWPEGESFRVTAKVETKQLRLAIKSNKDWFAASGELQIDEGKVMDLKTLLELMQKSQGRFVELGENRYLALTEELHRRLMEVSVYGEITGDGVRLHPLASFALEELADDIGGLKSDKLWKEHLARMEAQASFVPQLPSTLQAELRDYQLEGFNWLSRLASWGVGACLADDMGLGKTLQALALILSRAPQGPTLVVAPTSVCMNWISEAARFAPTLNVKLFGPGDRAETMSTLQPYDLVVTSYGLLQLESALFAGVQWNTIVLDEAQAIKNGATKRSQAVMALKGDFRMIATGTPLENHLGELWNLFRFINPGLLGSIEQFNLRFAAPIEKPQDHRAELGARNRLRRLIQPFMLRRTKAQVLTELPSRTEITMEVDLSAEETALYESLRRAALENLAAVEGPAEKKSIQILAEIMRLRRACCNPNLIAPELGLASSKLAAFAHLLEGLLENRHKVLVFSQFVDHLSLIRAHLDANNISYQYLDGSTTMADRKKRVDLFQSGQGDVFLISLKAGGVGINLTAADYVIHMDPWWNPAVEDQASDRAHRMGQLRPVTIYRLVARHTIEEGIVELHQHKRDLADSLLEGSDVSGRMSASEMLNMLQEGLKK